MDSHREALSKILRICHESSEYSRRMQTIHEIAMESLGLTYNQRQERHVKAMMRSERYKEQRKLVGQSAAKTELREKIKTEPQDEFYNEVLPAKRTWVDV